MPKRPEALVAIPTEEPPLPSSASLAEAMEPSTDSILLEEADLVSEPTAPVNEAPVKEQTPRSGERPKKLARVYEAIEESTEGIDKTSSAKKIRASLSRLGEYVDKLEERMLDLTQRIQQAEQQHQDTADLHRKREEAEEAIVAIKSERRRLNSLYDPDKDEEENAEEELKKNEEERISLEQGSRRELEAVSLREVQKKYRELSDLEKNQKIDELNHKKELLQQTRDLSEKEEQERQDALQHTAELLANLEAGQEESEEEAPTSEVPESGKRFITAQLRRQLKEAADAVRKEYGKDPEEILNNPFSGVIRNTKRAALILMGEKPDTAKEDPFEIWEKLNEESKKKPLPPRPTPKGNSNAA